MKGEGVSLPGKRFSVRTAAGEGRLPRRSRAVEAAPAPSGRAASPPAPPAADPPTAAADGADGDSAPFRSGFVAFIGRPNVGKSSLCNALVGDKVAIVSDKPQTTRRRIMAVLHLPGAQIVLLDTPGVHRPRHRLGQRMVAAARESLTGVEAACLVVDAESPQPGQNDRRAAEHVLAAECPRLLVLNKSDLVPPGEIEARAAAYGGLAPADRPFEAVVAVSALTGAGLQDLLAAILPYLPPGPAYFPETAITDQPEQFLAAELIREQALARLRDEVPHGVAVTIDEWKVRESGLIYLGATLYVERETHRGIVIGRGGSMLRAIGLAARLEIERRLGAAVYLDIWVKVKEDWRDRPGSLSTLGFSE